MNLLDNTSAYIMGLQLQYMRTHGRVVAAWKSLVLLSIYRSDSSIKYVLPNLRMYHCNLRTLKTWPLATFAKAKWAPDVSYCLELMSYFDDSSEHFSIKNVNFGSEKS